MERVTVRATDWALGVLVGSVFLARPTAGDDGRTIWGDDYNSTVRAMKTVMRAIGVKSCLHCHVKEGGSVAYEAETPNKAVARQMKMAFVDSLAARGRGEVDLSAAEAGRRVTALYKGSGADAGIELVVYMPPEKAGGTPRTHSARVALPVSGALECATCHNGSLHFVTEK